MDQQDREARWLAIYGASVAIQAHAHFSRGTGAPGPKDFDYFIEEAEAVADSAEEAADRHAEDVKSRRL